MTPMKTLRALFIVWLVIATTLCVYSVTAQDNVNIIVVHSNESKTLLYNPATHHEVRNETADGNIILTVERKKGEQD